ncbi:hypothetical protein EON67_00630 [archaeon]|nr:MAG: hypothetical protein EON67_00630 [archaeon]
MQHVERVAKMANTLAAREYVAPRSAPRRAYVAHPNRLCSSVSALSDADAAMIRACSCAHTRLRLHPPCVRATGCRGVTDARSLRIVSLAALLHDVADHKYSGSHDANELAARGIMKEVVRLGVRVRVRVRRRTTHGGTAAACPTQPAPMTPLSLAGRGG